MPKVSVVIPVYNTEKYIHECLNSVINQKLKDVEIICVDDGSTDGSLKILKQYAKKDKRIKIITQSNLKQGAARNNGMKVATGEYIAFLDSDDYWREDTLQILYKRAFENNLDMLSFSGINFIDFNRKLQENPYYQFKYLPEDFDTKCFNYKQCTKFIDKVAVSACLTFYKHEFLQKNNITFPENLYFEDDVFFTNAFLMARRCGICKETLYFRRVHSTSTTQNWSKHFSDYLQICEKVINLVEGLSVSSEIKKQYNRIYINNLIGTYNRLKHQFSPREQIQYEKSINLFMEQYDNTKKEEVYRLFGFIPLLSIEEK